jgi:protein SCO1/2
MTSRGLAGKLIWIIPTFTFMALFGFTVIWWAETSQGTLPVLGEIPEFKMTERSGRSFGHVEMIGRINVVYCFFTNCPSVCPVTGANISRLYNIFSGSDKVRFISISVDPDRDTLEALRSYAESWGVNDNRWLFLRAPIDEVIWFCEKGLMLPADGLPMGHSARFVLVDHTGHIRGYYDGMDESSVDILRQHITRIVQERS